MAIIEVRGNLIDYWHGGNIIGVTTNGFVKRNGCAVMGAGIAKTVRDTIHGIDAELGLRLSQAGNTPIFFRGFRFFTFPVKHNWWEQADIDLIRESAKIIEKNHPGPRIDFPRPGCGNGRLDWNDVKPVLEEVFVSRDAYVWSF